MKEERIICIGCPMGCRVTLEVDERGEVVGFKGNRCKEGKEYVLKEYRNPVRVLTTTLPVEGGGTLPVRTDRPIPKGKMREGVRALAKLRVRPPVSLGDVILEDLLGTGANVVATATLRERR